MQEYDPESLTFQTSDLAQKELTAGLLISMHG